MRRHLSGLHEDLDSKEYRSGWIWGIILHFFSYHHRSNSKQKLLYRRRRLRLKILRWCTNSKTISMHYNPGEGQELQKDEAEHVKQQMTARPMKLFKQEKHIQQELRLSTQSQLQETNSVPQLDSYSNVHGCEKSVSLLHKKSGSTGRKSLNSTPTKILGKPVSDLTEMGSQCSLAADSNQSSGRHNIMQEKVGKVSEISGNDGVITKKLGRAISDNSVQKFVGIMEVFKVNKELVLDIVQDSALGLFPEKYASTANRKFSRSGSFPLPNSFGRSYLSPTTLEHKQFEIWSFTKRHRSLDFLSVKPVALRTDCSVGRTKSEEPKPSSLESHHLALSVIFQNLLKDVKHIFKYTKKEKLKRKHTNSDGPHVGSSSTQTIPQEMNMGEISINSHSHQSDAPDPELHRIIRTASLNASLERYAELFEKSSSRGAKLSQSKSLRMSNEDRLLSRKQTPKFFRRISSLSELESFVSVLNEVSHSDPSLKIPAGVAENASVTTNVDEKNEQTSNNLNIEIRKIEPTEAVLSARSEGAITEANSQSSAGFFVHTIHGIDTPVGFNREIPEPKTCERQHLYGHVIERDTSREHTDQISAFVNGQTSPDDISSTEQHGISSGLNSNSFKQGMVEADSSLIAKEENNCFSPLDSYSTTDWENSQDKRRNDKDFARPDSKKFPDVSFNYVRNVLQLSGFIGNGEHVTWHSARQPLSPSLFQELETWAPEERCDNQLLFDLVNESLLDILSFSSSICQVTKRQKLVEQVWGYLSKKLDYIPEQDQSLDDIVGRDFVKDSWMNTQLDAEHVGLDLEDMVFDELLDQVLFL